MAEQGRMNKTEIIEKIKSAKEDSLKALKRLEEKQQEVRKFEVEYKAARQIKRDAINLFIPFAKFQVGDKVTIKNAINEGTRIKPKRVDAAAFISKVIVRSSNNFSKIEYEYKANRIKKNGEMSERALNRNWIDYNEESITKFIKE